ncbi:MAG TPA: hypothetical protein VGK00_10740 [Anaerolineales bacterium]|jgi:hypothetical protein
MQVGTVQKLISIFDQSFRLLGVNVSLEKLEDLSVTIHRAMTVQARHFHTLEHVFNFVDPQNAIVSLAALYHDIVYYQVDMGFSPQIWELISPYIRQENDNFFVVEHIPASERIFSLTLDIFDLHPGQLLSSVAALNEFLSALVMNKQLERLVREKDLALMTMCIEATIPFRGYTADGKNHYELMEARLPEVIRHYNLDITSEGLIDGIKTAVVFANKDIENFAETDPGRFLDNTWKLLPETNAALRMPDVYSIGAYRLALNKMKGFFDNLDADTVFSQYRGVPSGDDYAKMARLACNNVLVARLYLGIKILGTTILEALALATGGDAPLSLFMGDVPREGVTIKRLEYYLPERDDPDWVDHGSIIYQLLEAGRTSETTFDMKNSPLSLFIYKSLSPDQISNYLHCARDFYSGSLSADDFLQGIDPIIVQPIARACSIMVYTRREALLKYAGVE